MRKRKREKEIATARAIIEEYRQRSGEFSFIFLGFTSGSICSTGSTQRQQKLKYYLANIGYEALDQDHESTMDKKPKCVITDIN